MTNFPDSGQPVNYEGTPMVDKDSEHLKILSILWWVLAGLQCLGMCGGIVYIIIGIVAGTTKSHAGDPPMGIIFSCAGVFLIVLCATMAYLAYLTGKSLRERRRLMLCYIMSGLICLSFPLGTALGIFTFVVLARPAVKASFQHAT